ncbi:MAG: CapA family protein [Sandaracinaceae bacterium]|nr:CapA family protein [Sandaracinaceae bacterium]
MVGRDEAYREVFRDLAPTLSRADLAVVNLEVPITPRYRDRDPIEDVPVFRAPTHFLDALRAAGVDAVTIANNHAYDQGLRGLRNTMAAADERHLPLIGVGADSGAAARALVVPVSGARVAFAAWAEGTNHRPNGDEGASPRIAFLRDGTLQASLRAARAGDAHLVVAVFHWVHEDMTRPRPMMREAAREAAEAGADLIIGHGTHVPGSTEVIETSDGRRVRVLYSLGNLLAAMEEPAGVLTAREVGVRDAPLALVRTEWRAGRLEVAGVEVVHHWIARPIAAAPWLEGGALAVGRPVSITSELERLAATPCGRACDQRAAMYRRRVALMDEAMADLAEPMPAAPPPLVAIAAPPVPRPAPPRPAAPAEPALVAIAPTRRPPWDALTEPAPRSHTPRIVVPDTDPRLQPFLRGMLFPMDFVADGVAESRVDEAALGRLVALMREDRGLRCEITGYSTEAEAATRPSLGAMRARRLKVLVAGRGPSRSRFTTRGGPPGQGRRAGTGHVVVRLRR